jgi:hypothetical protein
MLARSREARDYGCSMRCQRTLLLAATLAFFLAGAPLRAEDSPVLLPTRDVDVTYDVTRPQKPRVRERVRWLAAEHLERVDASGRATTIFDHEAHAITLLTPATRTFRKLDQAPRRPLEPEPGAALNRGAETVVAGLPCTDWSWTEEGGEQHTVWCGRRRFDPALDRRRTNPHRGPFSKVRPAESRPLPRARELLPRACSRGSRRAVIYRNDLRAAPNCY